MGEGREWVRGGNGRGEGRKGEGERGGEGRGKEGGKRRMEENIIANGGDGRAE